MKRSYGVSYEHQPIFSSKDGLQLVQVVITVNDYLEGIAR